jgi:glycosyltransferase involved in cell wall biosynthesis
MKKRIIVRAPVLTRSGYGEHARYVLRALKKIEDKVDIYVHPTPWGKTGWIYEDNEERRWLDSLVKKTAMYQNQHAGQASLYDVSVQVTIPNEWQNLAPVNVGVTAGIETTKVAPVWIEKANAMDRIITVSNHSKDVYENTTYEATIKQTGQKINLKCNKEIGVVHYPVKHLDTIDLDLDMSTEFNFLTVAQWGPRKNLENTVGWFVEEFFDNPDVGLVVKTFATGNSIIDREAVTKNLSNFLKNHENRKCKIYLLHGDMSDEEMHSLYVHPKIKALISLTHGEGFGLPIFEAAYSGLPVLAPEWSGHVDFLFAPKKEKKSKKEKMRPHFARIKYDIAPVPQHAVWDGVVQQDSMWCYPQQGSYKMKLREVYKEYGRFKKHAKDLQKWVCKEFEQEKQYNKMLDNLIPGHEDILSDNDFDNLLEDLL